jgi:hypothetical protein
VPSRRSTLLALAGLVAGGGAVVGTGAFSTVEADRTATVETAGDASSLLGIEPGQNSGQYVTTDGAVGIDITDPGVNPNATTAIDQLLEITNNGTNEVAVGFAAEYAESEGDFGNEKYEFPYGWAYATNEAEDVALVLWASPKENQMDNTYTEVRPGLTTTGFDGSTLVDGTTIYDEVGDTYGGGGDGNGRTILPGKSVNVGLIIDTRKSTVEDNTIPGDLDDTITLVAESTDN